MCVYTCVCVRDELSTYTTCQRYSNTKKMFITDTLVWFLPTVEYEETETNCSCRNSYRIHIPGTVEERKTRNDRQLNPRLRPIPGIPDPRATCSRIGVCSFLRWSLQRAYRIRIRISSTATRIVPVWIPDFRHIQMLRMRRT